MFFAVIFQAASGVIGKFHDTKETFTPKLHCWIGRSLALLGLIQIPFGLVEYKHRFQLALGFYLATYFLMISIFIAILTYELKKIGVFVSGHN